MGHYDHWSAHLIRDLPWFTFLERPILLLFATCSSLHLFFTRRHNYTSCSGSLSLLLWLSNSEGLFVQISWASLQIVSFLLLQSTCSAWPALFQNDHFGNSEGERERVQSFDDRYYRCDHLFSTCLLLSFWPIQWTVFIVPNLPLFVTLFVSVYLFPLPFPQRRPVYTAHYIWLLCCALIR